MTRKYTTISVTSATYKILAELKREFGAKTWDDLIIKLKVKLDEYRMLELEQIMCNDLIGASAALSAWIKVLTGKGVRTDELPLVTAYLKPDPNDQDVYIVDREKCKKEKTTIQS